MADATPTYGTAAAMAATSDNERTMAVLAHVLQLVGGWIAPLVIFFVKRDSRFVSFHALQVLLLHIAYTAIVFCFMALGMVSFFLSVTFHQGANNAPPPAFFLFFGIVWLVFMGAWILMLVMAIVYGIKAGQGEWAEYPIFGRLARKILKIGPGGMDNAS
jgi:uncharacterized protein